MKAHTETVTIYADQKKVFEFLVNPANLPKWAVVFCRALRSEGSEWIVTTTDGEMKIRYDADAERGVIDMYVSPEPDVESPAFTRVVPNGQGTEYVFTLFQPPGMPDEVFAGQIKGLKKEFGVLKDLMEK